MNSNINALCLLLFIFSFSVIDILSLKCYQCADDKGDNCGDTFNMNGSGIIEIDSTSEYCWKLKVDFRSHQRVIRAGDNLEDRYSGIHCPEMNKCTRDDGIGVQSTRCCCQDKDFCNMASTSSVTKYILIFSAIFIYIFILK